MSRMTNREAEEEAQAAARACAALGLEPDEPLCSFCNSDSHVKPDCPIKATQERLRAEDHQRERRYGRLMSMSVHRKRR